MANVTTGVLNENDCETKDGGLAHDITRLKAADRPPGPTKFYYSNIVILLVTHTLGIYGIWLIFTSAYWYTAVFAYVLHFLSFIGIMAGVHRLWSHRSYKARTPLKVYLAIMSTVAYQSTIFEWARDHRVHHKFSETNADPTNAKRGFFFAHVGWMMRRKHPDVAAKGKCIDVSDMVNDKVLWFQYKNFNLMAFIFAFTLPLVIPVYGWNETWLNSLCIAVMLRWIWSLNAMSFINSAAHTFGSKPYDKNLNPTENKFVAAISLGEGFHNYHHTFPWDYKAAELSFYKYNMSTAFIDICAKVGLAYDLKTVSPEMIKNRVTRTGDGSHNIWGWGDKEQDPSERKEASVLHRMQ